MTQDPKKLPNWLNKQPPQEPPKSDSPPSSDAEDDVPPWLREDQPAPSKIKKVTPPEPEDAGEVAPWLEGLETNKTYKIGGTELSEEYLAAGDQLPDALESEMTYDSWMAQQLEARRPKDIEEEVPDDLLSLIQEDKPVVPEKSTGQLPDWFLGLEALDTSDAPDWFVADDEPPQHEPPDMGSRAAPNAPDAMPPWINNLVEAAGTPEPAPIDEIGSFFSSLPVEPMEAVSDDDNGDDVDWFSQLEPEDEAQTPAMPELRAPPTTELPDIDDFPDDDEPAAEVIIPQNELDAFFDNVAAARPSSLDDVEEPDLDWLRDEEARPREAPSTPEPQAGAPASEETLSWLNQLQNIVSSASRQTGALEVPPPGGKERRDPLVNDVDAEAAAFSWPETAYEEEDELPATSEADWLNDISPGSEMTIRTTLPENIPTPPARSSLLSGRLRRDEPELPPVPQASPAPAEPEPQSLDEENPIPEEELHSGWLNDDLFAEPQAPQPQGEEDDFFSLLQHDVDANVLEDSARAEAYPLDEEALSEADFASALEPEDGISTDEIYARLGMSSDEPAPAALEDDFFTRLGGEQTPAASEADQYGQWGVEEPAPAEQEDDFFTRLGGEQTPAASEADQYGQWGVEAPAPAEQEDDFFTRLGGEQTPAASAADQYSQQGLEDALREDDLFTQLGAMEEMPAAGTEDEYGQPAAEAAEEDDFFAALGLNDEGAQTESTLDKTDFFDALDLSGEAETSESPQAQETPEMPETPPEQDLFAPWSDQPAADEAMPDDFFAALGLAEEPIESGSDDEFYRSLGQGDEQPRVGEDFGDEAIAEPDFFASLDQPVTGTPPPERETPEAGYNDVESYLASLSPEQPQAAPLTDDLFKQAASVDLDALFAEPVVPERSAPSPEDAIPSANADWLAELEASVGDVSASAIVRQKEDRPVEELSDRLKKLRQRGEQVSTESAARQDDTVLPAPLAPAPFIGVSSADLSGSVALTPEQRQRVDLLKALVPQAERPAGQLSAIEATYDSPFMPGLEDTPESRLEPQPSQPAPRSRRRKRRRPTYRVDRLLVAAVIALAVILPFILPGARVGNLPPSSFSVGSAAQVAFGAVDAIQPGDLVLIGLEYGPTAAAELDGLTNALVRHILLRAAYPVVISGNPLGLLRAQNLFDAINADAPFLERIGARQPLAANSDYYLIRYLAGSVIGLRAFSQDSANLLLTDIRGQATNLVVRSLHEFKLVAVVTDRAEDLRAYAEQVAPLARAPLLAAVSYGAAPLAEPYVRSLGGGLLVGYQDAYTYADTLGLVSAQDIAQRVRVVPTDTPTMTPPPTETLVPSLTLPPTRTRIPPTATAIPPTPTVVLGTGTVIARQAVNMRSGPSTANDIIAAVPSGTTLIALRYNDDQTWVNVRLADGQEGWISAALLSITAQQSALPKSNTHAKRQAVDEGDGRATRTPRPTQAAATPAPPTLTQPSAPATEVAPTVTRVPATATPIPATLAQLAPTRIPATMTSVPATATLAPTEIPAAAATAEATEAAAAVAAAPASPSPGYRDERWYAMNLGIIASALVITLGMVVNIVRGLLRRGRRG